ncbi:MAG TPA: chitobiase/beta-hexosaminidase C-terminal domain-containing protein [Acidobacteriaceae bacterium]|jgi:hypothetical protein|nr:chitobiase/beta-hexosaminidase C-terminal domain-containing protein [Acidobacteriaceae bacterium]
MGFRNRLQPLRMAAALTLALLGASSARAEEPARGLIPPSPQTGSPPASPGEPQALVHGAVDDTDRVTLRSNQHAWATAANDLGAVEDSFGLNRMFVLLKRPVQQEDELEQFLREVHTPGTENYHHWLTPEEFGRRFGAADSDVAALTAWLESHGFAVGKVHPGRIAIEFSGNAGQVKSAFHTEIHRYAVNRNGETVFASAGEAQIPAAFAGLVAGLAPIGSLRARPALRVTGKADFNPKTHQATAGWTYPEPSGGLTYELTPGDFALQYDMTGVYNAGTTGGGQSIGILSYSNVDLTLVQAYRALFGLAANLPTVVIDGNDPGQNDDATEAYLDLEEAGAVAPAARVVLYTSAGSVVTDPLLTSGLRALEDNQVSVLSVSYTECEAELGPAGNAAWASLWQEAAAQGITVFVAAGDAGSAGCDDFNTQSFAQSGLAVNGIGSTPWDVSVGGTDFYYSNYAGSATTLTAQIGSYWSSTASGSPVVSLLQTAPEQAWNDAFGLNASDNGVYSANYSTIVAGGGGASRAALYPATGPATGYAKPVWQAGAGVPADKVRDTPDVSLFAGDGSNYVEYPICAAPGDCVGASGTTIPITSVGGTSAATPAMAAIQALVNQGLANQATGSRQGQADVVYYALAAKTLTAKPFRDVTAGGNAVPCFAGSANCVLGSSGSANGNYVESGYAAGTGYDPASGLGTVDVANLIANWQAASFQPSTTTLSISPATVAHGKTVTVSATAAAKTGAGTPTGNVALTSSDAVAGSNGLGLLTLSAGSASATISNLPGGSYQVLGNYSGDSTYAASTSVPVAVTVAPEQDTLNTSAWVVNPIDGSIYPLQAGLSIPYGAEVYVDAEPMGVNEVGVSAGQATPATGAVSFTDTAGTVIKTASVPLNSEGIAEWVLPSLTVGSHTIGASYAGDASYNASTAATAATMTIFKGTTTIYLQPMETTVAAGSSVTVDLLIYSDVLPLNGVLPTGTVAITLGGQTQTIASPFKSWGTTGSAIEEVVATFAAVPAGILPLSATYSGDANWGGSSALFGSVQALAARPAPTVTLSATATAFTPSQTVSLSGAVTGSAATGVPGGAITVTWENGSYSANAQLVAATTASSSWSLNIPAAQLTNGANTFIATFPGDQNYSAQSSAPLTLTLSASDFSLITTTQEVAITPGKTGTGTVYVTPINAFSGTVAITCSASTGITCAPATVTPTVGSGVSDTITFTVASTVAGGTYPAILTAAGGGHTHSAQILVAYTPVTSTPSFSPAGGSYSGTQTVTITDTTAGAVIYCTVDGSPPTTASALCSSPLTVKATETVRAVALSSGYSISAAASATYTISTSTQGITPPIFSVAAGTYNSAQTVTITDSTDGATIYYSVNGITPTNKSNVYTQPVTIAISSTLQAIAQVSGGTPSSISSATYSLVVAPTVFSPPSGTYPGPLTVTITDPTPSTHLAYTPNGNVPSVYASYTGPITLTASGKVYSLGQLTGYTQSSPVEAIYTIGQQAATPVFSLAAGSYSGAQSVTITDATAGATIYYTTNGSTPTTASPVYTGAIAVGSTETLSAIAVATGYLTSAAATAIYTITSASQTAASPIFSLAAGTYNSAQTVTITDGTAGATIYYSVNGITPTNKSNVYTQPITIAISSTLQAIAQVSGGTPSSISSAVYSLVVAPTVFSPPSGTYPGPLTVTITDPTPATHLAYTPNGNVPSVYASYTGPITLTASGKVYSLGQLTGYTQSSPVEATYTITSASQAVASPAFSVPGGTYNSTQTVAITAPNPAAAIYYTLDGVTPTNKSPQYSGPIAVAHSATLQAIAETSNGAASEVSSATYTLVVSSPVFSPPSGSYPAPLTVTLTDATPGAQLAYTPNGDVPTVYASYTGPFTVGNSGKVYARGQATGYTTSSTAEAEYTIEPAATTPVFSVVAGTCNSAVTISIDDATSAARLYYTVDGTAPTASSNRYAGPVTVYRGETLKTIAIASGYSPSAIAASGCTTKTLAAR